MAKRPKPPGDPNQLAKLIVEQASGGAPDDPVTDERLRSQMAKLLGRPGAPAGGPKGKKPR